MAHGVHEFYIAGAPSASDCGQDDLSEEGAILAKDAIHSEGCHGHGTASANANLGSFGSGLALRCGSCCSSATCSTGPRRLARCKTAYEVLSAQCSAVSWEAQPEELTP